MGLIVLNVGPSEALSISQDLCITGMSLQVGPASAGGHQRVVNVWAEDGHDAFAIGTLSLEAPIVPVRPQLFLNDEFLMRHDAVAATVRFYARVPGPPPPPSAAGAEESRVAVLDDDGEVEATALEEDGDGEDDVTDEASWVEFRPLTEEEEAERYDSDNGEEDEDGGGEEDDEPPQKASRDGEESSKRASIPIVAAPAGSVVPDGEFLGPARYAAVGNTAGFMRVAASGGQEDEGKGILVLYRYTRFSRTWCGVEACRRTKLHRVRFAVPPAGDMASSLAWAGSSLGPLIYPALFRRQLHELWATLSAPAMSTVPPKAARVQVIVDVGILRRDDRTPERMDHMRGALEAKMQEAWPEYCHVGMELQLPEPVPDDEEQGDDTRTAKRRKIADEKEDSEEDECAVCFDRLESGLAAWPGCRHVFHGACVEKTLAGSEMCPLCRTKLSDQLVR